MTLLLLWMYFNRKFAKCKYLITMIITKVFQIRISLRFQWHERFVMFVRLIKLTLHNEMNKVGIWRWIYCDRNNRNETIGNTGMHHAGGSVRPACLAGLFYSLMICCSNLKITASMDAERKRRKREGRNMKSRRSNTFIWLYVVYYLININVRNSSTS